MISKKDEYILAVCLTNERLASEVVARAIDSSADPAAAIASLAIIDDSAKEQKELREYWIVATASRVAGEEIAEQQELVVECLEYQAADIVGNNAALNAAQAKIKPLSDATKEILVVAMANRAAAARVAAEIDAAGVVAAGIADAV